MATTKLPARSNHLVPGFGTPNYAYIEATHGGAQELVPALPGMHILVFAFSFHATDVGAFEYRSGTTQLYDKEIIANLQTTGFSSPHGVMLTAVGEALNAYHAASCDTKHTLVYTYVQGNPA